MRRSCGDRNEKQVNQERRKTLLILPEGVAQGRADLP
jgi:hypothetical protein